MPLPTPVKTWEYLTNQAVGGLDASTSFKNTAIRFKNLLTNTVAHIYNRGNIQLVSGTTFRINPADNTFSPTKIGNVVGRTLKLRGMTTANNNGNYTVTAQSDQGGGVYALEYVNASGAAEAIVGSVNVIGNDFTIPLVLRHSASAAQASVPVADDGIDRLETLSSFTFGPTSFDNSYFVLRNTVTGTEFCWYCGNATDADSGSNATRGGTVIATAPGVLSAPAAIQSALNNIPLGQVVEYINGTKNASYQDQPTVNTLSWPANVTWDGRLNVMMSDDGEQVRAWFTANSLVSFFMFDSVVRNPKAEWALDANTPVVAGMFTPQSTFVARADYANWNDVPSAVLSRIPSVGPGRPDLYAGPAYLSVEGYIAAALGQNLLVANELTGEWPLSPVGIVSSLPSYRGRMGLVPDMWWTSTALVSGQTFPNTAARNFIVVGNFVLPWNGDIPEMM